MILEEVNDILSIPFEEQEKLLGSNTTDDWYRMTRDQLIEYCYVVTAQRNEYRRRLEQIVEEKKICIRR